MKGIARHRADLLEARWHRLLLLLILTAEIHWNDPDGKAVIREHRTLTVQRDAATGGWQIDWSTKLESQVGSVQLAGDRQHAGFQFRADQG